jgi:hypothetical protein
MLGQQKVLYLTRVIAGSHQVVRISYMIESFGADKMLFFRLLVLIKRLIGWGLVGLPPRDMVSVARRMLGHSVGEIVSQGREGGRIEGAKRGL